uniref:M20_dimer domain-containing protein n=1 Tax=Strongyloides stercoralis TaxID=6248 RepID=A0A0K0EFW0_STRER
MTNHTDKLFQHIDSKKSHYIERLRKAVEIPSISAEAEHRKDVFEIIDHTQKELEKLGVECKKIANGKQTLPDGVVLDLPPVLFGTYGKDPSKKTLLVYGHLDVQPAKKEDGWNTEPFKLIEKDGKLFGRGATDDKGPVYSWINALEAMKELNIECPVNIKFVFEGMEESGSEGLDDILIAHQHTFLKDVDFSCISDNYWLGKSKPCITYGLRGVSYYCIEIHGVKQDLHSGVHGGVVHEPLNDLVWVMSQLVDNKGKILVEGLDKLVAPLTKEEEKLYANIDFDVKEYADDIGAKKLISMKKEEILMNRMRYPSLSLHGVEGAFYGPGAKTVIPSKVIGKFSIRTVPNMEPKEVDKLVVTYLNKIWSKRGSPNNFKVIPLQGGRSWLGDTKDSNFIAGKNALVKVFGVEPDYTREGGSIPVTLTIEELTKKSVMLLPIGASDDMAHSQNEKINVSNYIEGTKVLATYILELGKV